MQQKLRKKVTKTFHEFDWSISCHLSQLFWTVSHVVVATVLPEDIIIQKMPDCGSISQTLLTSLIILVDLTILILSDKLLLDIQLMHTFIPNMIHKPWMVSDNQYTSL